MNIKKSIVGSMFSMLLVSEMAAADWGDVYFCQMTNFDGITLEGEKVQFKLEKFQFKLDQTKNAMVFGNRGVFTGRLIELLNNPIIEVWNANDKFSMTYFKHGKFLLTQNANEARIISADCDKF